MIVRYSSRLTMRTSKTSVLAALLLATAVQADAPHLHLAKRWSVPGEGGWDYLTPDATARRLYVTHSTGVDVLDLDQGKPLGRIEPTLGVHGVALAPELNRGFVSCGRDSSVLVFDLKTLATVQRIALPARNPDAILYEPSTRRVFTFNGGSANTTAIDAATDSVLGSVSLGGKPEFAVSDGRGRVFVNIEDTSELVELDPRGLAVLRRWPLAPGEEPSGLAMDREHRRLFSVCGNGTMVVSDADSGRVIANLPIGKGTDGAAFDPSRGLAFSSNGEGTVSVVREESPARFSVVETDSTERGARTIALDEKTGRVFSVTASFGPPPEPTAEHPRPRPTILPGTFRVLVLSR